MRNVVVVAGIAILVIGIQGCLTTKVLDRWEDSSRDASLDLRVQRIDKSELDVRWRSRSNAYFWSSGELALDPKLERCDSIDVLAIDADGLIALEANQEQRFARSAPAEVWQSGSWDLVQEPDCTVLVAVQGPTAYGYVHSLHASVRERDLGTARIPAARNPFWLGLVPPAAVADALTLPVSICLTPDPDNSCAQMLADLLNGLL